MSKLVWDQIGERLYETGVDKGVLYPQVGGAYPKGVAWSGLTGVTKSPSGAEPTPMYADNIKYLNLMSVEELGLTIEAYMYPKEFATCNGEKPLGEGIEGVFVGQQDRQMFGFCYRTLIGNDTEFNKHGYKLHLIYGCLASPSEMAHATVNDSPEAITMSWEVTTTPVPVTGGQPTASIVIDSTLVDSAKLTALETMLYGDDDTEPKLPMPDEIASLFAAT